MVLVHFFYSIKFAKLSEEHELTIGYQLGNIYTCAAGPALQNAIDSD